MASAPEATGNLVNTSRERIFTRKTANEIMARALGREIRAQHYTNEKLERLSGVPERRIEMLRSFTEEAPVQLEDLLSLAAVLGERFLTGIVADLDMYVATYNGASPEKIGAEIIQLATMLTGGFAQ
jgi:hypothetical protein